MKRFLFLLVLSIAPMIAAAADPADVAAKILPAKRDTLPAMTNSVIRSDAHAVPLQGAIGVRKDSSVSVPRADSTRSDSLTPKQILAALRKSGKKTFDSIAKIVEAEGKRTQVTKTRLKIKLVDAAINGYKQGKLLAKISQGTNECIGEKLEIRIYQNGLTTDGAEYNIWARDWCFHGDFQPILGLERGMTVAQVQAKLGAPSFQTKGRLVYLSQKPGGYEDGDFEARWQIDLLFSGDSLQAVFFAPSFDDC